MTCPSLTRSALNWQVAAQVPQPVQSAVSARHTYPDDASIGVPRCHASIAPQQHEQQLQMA
jgi:hypothetical protein